MYPQLTDDIRNQGLNQCFKAKHVPFGFKYGFPIMSLYDCAVQCHKNQNCIAIDYVDKCKNGKACYLRSEKVDVTMTEGSIEVIHCIYCN